MTTGEHWAALTTSRYQERERIGASGMVPVRITLGAPRWKLGYELGGSIKALAPTRALFALRGTGDFEPGYLAQLEGHGVEAIAVEIGTLSADHGGRGLVLLCFEDVHELGEGSCHRRMFAHWWEAKTGRRAPEL